MGGVDELGHLLVDDRRGGLREVLRRLRPAHPHERFGIAAAELDGADSFAHAVLGDHGPRHLRGLLDVVLGAGGGVVEDHFLRGPAAHHVGHLVQQLAAGVRVLVVVGHHHRVAERAAARQDRDLLDGIVAGHRGRHEGVPALVVGGDEAFTVVHQAGAFLRSRDHPVDGLVELRLPDLVQVQARGQEGGLVQDVGQVGAGETGGAAGHGIEVDVLGQGFADGVHLEDVGAADQVGGLHGDLPVETARAQQRRVEHVGAVRRGDQDHPAAHVEPVHLDQQLVEGLLAFVVAAAHAGAAVAADGVDLVDEDDGGRGLLGLLEQVADPAGADTDEHLDEIGAGD